MIPETLFPPSRIANREQVIAMLSEAAEVEHTLMCCYLYAVFSLKTHDRDGLTDDQLAATRAWRGSILSVAVEEMGHLALVSNLLCAIGGVAHFGRPNFPVPAGVMPANMTVRLAPFDMATLDHFIFLERPEASALVDAEQFLPERVYRRGPLAQSRLMPVVQDYQTVGELYETILSTMTMLSEKLGEENLFVGSPDRQVGPDCTPLPGLLTIASLADATLAIDTIVEQGEGAPQDCGAGHFARFRAIKAEYERLLAEDPAFRPGRPVAENPVMRRPPTPDGKVWVTAPDAAALMDYVNALYIHMLRLLAQAFGRPGDVSEKRLLVNAGAELMYALTPAAEVLTRLRANNTDACNAGMSFAMILSIEPLPAESEWSILQGRFKEIVEAGRDLARIDPDIGRSVQLVANTAAQFDRAIDARKVMQPPEPSASPSRSQDPRPTPADAEDNPDGVVDGRDVILSFDTERCVHARFCVSGAPETFLANVDGPWLHPDRSPPDLLSAIARQCPSGAITLGRKDGRPDEAPPQVNILRVRENGPLALHADLHIDGEADGYRRTLCRCGLSAAKPYCDGSHAKAAFIASGEPDSRTLHDLVERSGQLDVQPLIDGPLLISGPLEICSGTGRAVARTRSVRLCRCGGSSNKPFCDNTHARIGFRSANP